MSKKDVTKTPDAKKKMLDKARAELSKAATKELTDLKKAVIKLEKILARVHVMTKPKK